MAEYSLTPVSVPQIETKYRSIRTALPVPETLGLFERLRKSEPRSMSGQPPVVWHSAKGFTVADKYGNRWIDWSSGVLITNAGHGHDRIEARLREIVDQSLLATYCFVHEGRVELVEKLQAAGIEAAVIGKLTEGGKYMLVNGMRLPLEQPGSDALYDAKL